MPAPEPTRDPTAEDASSDRSTRPRGPLADIRVIEFAQVLAVPTCGLLLADLGADVIKIEPPRGDTYRLNQASPIRTEGRAFAVVNRGKRSLCLDLTQPDARAVVERLVCSADVVLVSFKPSDLERFGLSYAQLQRIRPDLVYLQNSAYGDAGPAGSDGGYDVVVQGMSGTGSLSSACQGGTPRFVQPAYVDVGTGFLAALGVVSALRHRDRTGEGQRVETSLLATALTLGSSLLHRFEALDGEREAGIRRDLGELRESDAGFGAQQQLFYSRAQPSSSGNIYYRHFRTRDGFISIGCLSPNLYRRLRKALDLMDPRQAPDFDAESSEGRTALRAFEEQAEKLFASRDTAAWLEHLRSHGVPCGPFSFPHEVMDDPQVQANGYLVDLDHPLLGRYRTFAPPIRLAATPTSARGPSPTLDSDRVAVLGELGFSTNEIEELERRQIVGRHHKTLHDPARRSSNDT